MKVVSRYIATAIILLSTVFATSSIALAQNAGNKNAAYFPIWNSSNGKVEALLMIEPTATNKSSRWQSGMTGDLQRALGLNGSDRLGMLCKNSSNASTISNMADNCVLAAIDGTGRRSNNSFTGLSFSRDSSRVGVIAGNNTASLPNWLATNNWSRTMKQNSLTIFGDKNIGRQGLISIGGTIAHATLIPAGDVPQLADRWSMKALTVGAGYGNFSASIIGRVIDTPNQPSNFSNLGVGFNWRAPWKGQFSIGADNVITRGKNPLAPIESKKKDDGAIPYVRYQQDL